VKVPFHQIDPARLFYVEPHDLGGVTYPTRWSLSHDAATPGPGFFPPWQWDTIRRVRRAAPDVSVHGEVFSPFSQLMELVDQAQALMALVLEPAKVLACLARLTEGAALLACGHFEAGADAVLISSAFAGAGFLSPAHYRQFVLPFEREIISRVRERFPGMPIYTHTCGAIGDRLELMEETGTSGIDTLDPPPLGTVDLGDARRRLGLRVFIKGNVDPVNTVLRGTPEQVRADAERRLAAAMAGGGYILSTACSVPPHAPPENIRALTEAAERWGHAGED
jgi:uroporphyrinogen-III decarboxylase